jgi:hypothetical protein
VKHHLYDRAFKRSLDSSGISEGGKQLLHRLIEHGIDDSVMNCLTINVGYLERIS